MYRTWEELYNECKACQKCELCKTRTNVVVGVGNPNADIMFIGEGPGENEDLQGEPFVGRAGKLLDKMLAAVDLDRNKNIFLVKSEICKTVFIDNMRNISHNLLIILSFLDGDHN